MKTFYHMPMDEDVLRLLTGLLGKKVKADKTVQAAEGSLPILALYMNEEGIPGSIACCDYMLSACMAGALTMIPPAAAQDAAKTKDFPDSLRENLREVFNICASLMNAPAAPRLILSNVFMDLSSLPDAALEILKNPAERLDLEVDVAGYGKGRMALMCAS